MRCLLIGIAVLVAVGALLSWPYRLEEIAVRVGANPTACQIYVRNWSGWTRTAAVPFQTDRLADPVDAHIFVDNCPGKPAAITLQGAGEIRHGESCGTQGRADFGCQVPVPPALGRYRLTIQTGAGKSQAVEVEVIRQHEWRSGTLDAIMSV